MQKPRPIWMILLLPNLILGISSACSPAEEQEPGDVQQATTVLAAAQVIDLSFLSLPTEIKAKGRSEVGYKSFELWDDVASVVGLYQPLFIEDGWQNDADHEYTDGTTANRYFSKNGFVVSMTVSDLGEGTAVTFINHGNVDLRTLPQTADAQPLYQSPDSLVYASPSTVNAVTDFTRQELAAHGWHQCSRLDTANRADSQGMVFIQNGLELSVSASVAPDQGDKTVVEYNITLLPLDLPVHGEPLGLEFRRNPPYLGYLSAADISTLIDFYLAEMSVLGWTEMPETASRTPEQVAIFFVGQKLYANDSAELTVVLEFALADGQTKVTLRQVDAEEINAVQ